MSDSSSNLPGAVPPKAPEGAKVQPKKETVRINLPPKPSAAPTIKIPAPPAGRTPSAPAAGPAAAPAAAPAGAAPAAAATAAPAAAPRAAAPGTAPRPAAPRPLAPAISGLDKGLAVTAVVLSVGVLVRLVLVMMAP